MAYAFFCSWQPFAIISASVPCLSFGRLHSTPSPISNTLCQTFYPHVWMVSCLLNSFLLRLWEWVPSVRGDFFIFFNPSSQTCEALKP